MYYAKHIIAEIFDNFNSNKKSMSISLNNFLNFLKSWRNPQQNYYELQNDSSHIEKYIVYQMKKRMYK